ncbi:methionine--tRNA ligase [Rhodothalassium salexigens]|uniref:methionine--tRNA ligase n=1 Tax=Rhodothalassium salexigens TaxID=1086 RepID=UPI0019146F53|nr:methionine--tRNA ligase [Rhodothalassium salexigens]MBK5911884.1 methionine--tRNA ligase [Rhodothalassium salexigens]MBK5920979.1 methionine--tRNA ligase [Rhodothalassium salexigens]
MSADKTPFYVTTPIYYVNDVPHIGHAYTTLACDMLARFKRLDGHEVFFLTGTDEHGQKVQKSAAQAGVDPQAFCDRVSERFKVLLDAMNFSNDQFIRTTEDRHKRAAQDLWRRIADNGHIYLDSYAGWYAVRDEAYYAESELTRAADGSLLAPTGAPVEWVEEESYFFDLSKWQQPLLDLYDRRPDFVKPHSRLNEVRSFVAGGLRDLSISRTTFDWGVPVPDAPGHIMYVWIDALTNYLTALDYPETGAGSAYDRFWPQALHMVGKDILRFHAVYWPAFLMAAGLEPPHRVFAHGWWTKEGQKISKSLGNVLDPFDLVERFGRDPVRYFMMREVPFGNDGDFSTDGFVGRCNADLANGIGNLAQRTLSMIHKNCAGAVPEPETLTDDDLAFLAHVDAALDDVRPHIDAQAPHLALEAIWARVSAGDGYISAQAPWTLKKTDPARMATVLYVTAEAVRQIAILMQPIVPEAAASLLDQLGQGADDRRFDRLGAGHRLTPGIAIAKPQGVFPRIEAEAGV